MSRDRPVLIMRAVLFTAADGRVDIYVIASSDDLSVLVPYSGRVIELGQAGPPPSVYSSMKLEGLGGSPRLQDLDRKASPVGVSVPGRGLKHGRPAGENAGEPGRLECAAGDIVPENFAQDRLSSP